MARVKAWPTKPIHTLYIDGWIDGLGPDWEDFSSKECVWRNRERRASITHTLPPNEVTRSFALTFHHFHWATSLATTWKNKSQKTRCCFPCIGMKPSVPHEPRGSHFAATPLKSPSPLPKGGNSLWLNRLFIHASFLMKLAYWSVDLFAVLTPFQEWYRTEAYVISV